MDAVRLKEELRRPPGISPAIGRFQSRCVASLGTRASLTRTIADSATTDSGFRARQAKARHSSRDAEPPVARAAFPPFVPRPSPSHSCAVCAAPDDTNGGHALAVGRQKKILVRSFRNALNKKLFTRRTTKIYC